MAGPVSGVGQHQIPLATTFQPGQNQNNEQVRQDNKPQENIVRSQGFSPQALPSGQQSVQKPEQSFFSKTADSNESAQKRGSLVDITV